MKTVFNIFSKVKIREEPKVRTKIIADYREKNSLVISELHNLGIDVDFQPLKVGDFLVNGVVIERKTVSDFISSMLNRRLINQLEEMQQYSDKLLLIEGLDEKSLYSEEYNGEGMHPNSVRGFLLSIALRHKVPIIFSKNYSDTASFIYVLSKRQPSETPLNVNKKTLSDKETAQMIIEGFPGIGPKTARKLLKKFGSVKSIINATDEQLQNEIGKKADALVRIRNKKI